MARELRPKEQHYIVLRQDRLGWSADLKTASGRVLNTINGDREDSRDRVLRAARRHWPDALYARQRRDNGDLPTGRGFQEIQQGIRRYARRVYGSDVEVETAIPIGGGRWEFWVRYPRGRAFRVRANHRTIFPQD